MAEIQIQEQHKPMLTRAQHVLEWLSGEQQRLQAELSQVAQAGQREQAKLLAFVRQAYGVDMQKLDVDAGTISTADPEPAEPENVTPFLNRKP